MFRLSRLILPLLLAFAPISPQAQVVGGSIAGIVTDNSGAAVRGAHVVTHNVDTGSERTLVTGADGRYIAPSLPAGSYTVAVRASGFGTQLRSGIALAVGQMDELDLSLSAGAVAETVDVEDTPPAIDHSTQQTSGLVDSRQVKELPLNGRSYNRTRQAPRS